MAHCTSPLNKLDSWILDERVLNSIRGTGFDTFRGISIKKNLVLISSLLDKYNLDTNCFELGVNGAIKLYFGLEDVLYLTGFPITGIAVTGKDDLDPISVCVKYLGANGVVRTVKKGAEVLQSVVPLSWLLSRFMTVPEHVVVDTSEFFCYVRAYILYAIGCIIAPDLSSSGVSVSFLPLLENIGGIGDYAWGAALLANVQFSLNKNKRVVKPAKEYSGCIFALMVFALERIPNLATLHGITQDSVREITQFPLLVSWAHALRRTSRDNFSNRNKLIMTQFLEGLEEDNIIWQPYPRLPGGFLPQFLEQQVILGQSRTVLICFEKVVHHRPDLVPRQFGLPDDFQCRFTDPVIELKLKGRSGPKGRNWSTFQDYSKYNSLWEQRLNLMINEVEEHIHIAEPEAVAEPIPSPTFEPNLTEAGPSRTPVEHVEEKANSPSCWRFKIVYKRRLKKRKRRELESLKDTRLPTPVAPKRISVVPSVPKGFEVENKCQQLKKRKRGEVAQDECFLPLTTEEKDAVSQAFSFSNQGKVLVLHENSKTNITVKDLKCLEGRGWLNDKIVDVYFCLLKERETREPQKFLKCHFFNSFLYKKLIDEKKVYDYGSVRRWTTQKKLGYTIFECDKIFVPIHNSEHWCLAVINKKDKKLQYLDPLGEADTEVLNVLAMYYSDEVNDKNEVKTDVLSWRKEYVKNLPLQKNGFDCGMFVLKYADFYSRGLGLCFNQEQMPYFRFRTAKEILRLQAK